MIEIDIMVKISIIIPTLNEEKYLERLLKSIEKQDFEDYEIIVSDSNSDDNTMEIAKKYGAKIVTGEKKGPGYARNLGAKKANGEYLLFIDADVILRDKNTFFKINKELKDEKVACGIAISKGCDGNKIENALVTMGLKFYEFLIRMQVPMAPGFFIFTRKKLFEKVDGFDEELPFCEDLKFIKEISKFGKSKLLKSKINISSRRLSDGGFIKITKDYFPSMIAYLINEDYLKEKFEFNPASSIADNKILKN